MIFKTDYKLEDFILNCKWENIPEDVKERLRGCFIDLVGALLAGTKSEQFKVGLSLAEKIYGEGSIAVIGTDKKFNFMGASAAMGHSSNAYDIDDGHNMTRAHPGTSFIGGVLAAAYEKDLSLADFLSALLAAYEATIRMGAAIMDYYNYAHSSGTFGAIGVVAGVFATGAEDVTVGATLTNDAGTSLVVEVTSSEVGVSNNVICPGML